MEDKKLKICFPINEHGWVLLFQLLGKTILCAEKVKNKGYQSDTNGHRICFLECEGGVKVKSKIYDISKFIIEEKK
ncbi:MAG: hypothetical protein WC511_07485 [Candidatus Pacearchaeota archaeon]|jgi:hypothetical protein